MQKTVWVDQGVCISTDSELTIYQLLRFADGGKAKVY
jgi:hypothetical protein